jgi:hypothetical protein
MQATVQAMQSAKQIIDIIKHVFFIVSPLITYFLIISYNLTKSAFLWVYNKNKKEVFYHDTHRKAYGFCFEFDRGAGKEAC